MVIVTISRNKKDEVEFLQVHGHAGYADRGQDIVCSAVSVLTLNTVNSISHLLGITLYPTSKDGVLECRFPTQSDDLLHSKMHLLLNSMLLGIKAIKDNYGDFVEIKFKSS